MIISKLQMNEIPFEAFFGTNFKPVLVSATRRRPRPARLSTLKRQEGKEANSIYLKAT